MTFYNLLLLFIIIFLILLSGFLSGSETAITAASKAKIISKIKKGSKKATYVKKIIDMKDRVISSLLLSNNLVNVLSSALATAFLYKIFDKSFGNLLFRLSTYPDSKFPAQNQYYTLFLYKY